jgi:hypothetical protein
MAIFLLPRDSNHVYNLFTYYVLVLHIMVRMLVLTSAKIEPRVREENNGSTSKLTYTHAHSHADADVIKKGVHNQVYYCTIFPELLDIFLRTDESFRAQSDKNQHKGFSPLLDLNINMISCFPHNYMHLVFLWVFKRLLTIWMEDLNTKHVQQVPVFFSKNKLKLWYSCLSLANNSPWKFLNLILMKVRKLWYILVRMELRIIFKIGLLIC